ncbi:unnamed protein product [Closterium sp. Yama58-4]|nr:unnamed protein product [Closterium sp. Yama58-4]
MSLLGGEFTSDLLLAFCEEDDIRQSFTLSASPQQNGVTERRIGLVMEVAHTSMIHAAAPHFLWSFAVRYAAHQLNLWPRVSVPETSPTLRWTGEVGDASRFRVWGARAFVRDLTTDKLPARAIPRVFLGFPLDAPGWQFYDPASRRVFASQGVTFDESVPFYRLFPYRIAPLPPPALFLAPGPPQVDPLPPPGPAPSGVSQVDPPLTEPVEVTGDSGPIGGGPARGAEPERAEPGGAEPGGAEPEGAEPEREEPGGAESGGAEPGGAEPEREEPGGTGYGGAESGVTLVDVSLSLHSSYTYGTLAVRVALLELGVLPLVALLLTSLALVSEEQATLEQLGLRTLALVVLLTLLQEVLLELLALELGMVLVLCLLEVLEPLVPEVLVLEVLELLGLEELLDLVVLLLEVLGLETLELVLSTLELDVSFLRVLLLVALELEVLALEVLELLGTVELLPGSPLPAPSPFTEQTGGLAERRDSTSRLVSPVRTGRTGRVPRECPPAVPGTHTMVLRPSSVPQRVPLLSPPASSLPDVPDPESDRFRATHPTVTRLLATVVTNPSFESAAASALVAELVDFAALCRLDYAASLVAESESVCPPSVGGECALGTDVLKDS